MNVHAALADTANDLNDNQIWFGVAKLSLKARVGRSTAMNTLSQMITDGFIEVVSEQRGSAAPKVHRLLFPADAPVVYEDGTSPKNGLVQKSDQSKKGAQLVQKPDSSPITQHKEPKTSSRAKKSAESPNRLTARQLTVLAMEQPTKPAGANAFVKALGIIEAILDAGHPADVAESAIRAGGIVWSIGGFEMAMQKLNGGAATSRNARNIRRIGASLVDPLDQKCISPSDLHDLGGAKR